jgi:hypothetical protein
MLTHQQILHFNTFGYLTLRGLFSQPGVCCATAGWDLGSVDLRSTSSKGCPAQTWTWGSGSVHLPVRRQPR